MRDDRIHIIAKEGAEKRWSIRCIHNAADTLMEALTQLVSNNSTPAQMHDVLEKPDISLTNAKDKEAFLPYVKGADEHVKDMMALI